MTAGFDPLRDAWRSVDDADSAECASDELIWRSLTGELPAAERRAVIAHTATCSTCAAAWRAAKELVGGDEPRARENLLVRSRNWLLLAASVAFAVTGVALFVGRAPGGQELRGEAPAAIVTEMPDHARLPRERFVLHWRPGPAGTVYNVEVGSLALKPIAHAVAVSEPRFQVPADALRDVASGTTLLWRVEAQFPSGERVSSVTLFATVE